MEAGVRLELCHSGIGDSGKPIIEPNFWKEENYPILWRKKQIQGIQSPIDLQSQIAVVFLLFMISISIFFTTFAIELHRDVYR
jgi:hypothetical protein